MVRACGDFLCGLLLGFDVVVLSVAFLGVYVLCFEVMFFDVLFGVVERFVLCDVYFLVWPVVILVMFYCLVFLGCYWGCSFFGCGVVVVLWCGFVGVLVLLFVLSVLICGVSYLWAVIVVFVVVVVVALFLVWMGLLLILWLVRRCGFGARCAVVFGVGVEVA